MDARFHCGNRQMHLINNNNINNNKIEEKDYRLQKSVILKYLAENNILQVNVCIFI